MTEQVTQLGLVDRIEAQLATITNPADAAQLTRDIRAFKTAAGNRKYAGKATVLYAKAARRAGELLAEIPRDAGGRPARNSSHGVTSFQDALADCQIDHMTAHRWQWLARVDDDAFADWCEQVESGEVDAALSALLKLGRPATQRTRSPIVLGERVPSTRLLVGDVRQCLATLEPDSIQCVVTSPPYWGLRSYSTEPQVWGQTCCEHPHKWSDALMCDDRTAYSEGNRRKWQHGASRNTHPNAWQRGTPQGQFCEHEHKFDGLEAVATDNSAHRGKAENTFRNGAAYLDQPQWRPATTFCGCGAWLGELGTEPTPELYVEHIVEVMRGVRRVLRPDGVLWVNLDSSYAGSGRGPTGHNGIGDQERRQGFDSALGDRVTLGYKPKDLVPTPWLVAMALQRDGWYWRSTVAWCKKAPMPSSAPDRPTHAWEPLFLFAKSPHYYWDADAVRDPETGHNLWDYWPLGPEPFPDAHFATFPTAVVEPCIRAGTSERGCCPTCGAPWLRVVDISYVPAGGRGHEKTLTDEARNGGQAPGPQGYKFGRANKVSETTGWRPTCAHADLEPVACTVLDPFAGAGTTSLVAARLGRDSIGIELNESYARLAAERIEAEGVSVETVTP